MALFTCKLGSSDGRVIVKELEAVSHETLRQTLEDQGYYVFEVKKKPFQFLWDKGIARKKVSNKDLLTFNQELLVLIKAGLPIVHAFNTILERAGKGKLAEILKDVREDVKGGTGLSDAFEKFPSAFSHLYVASIRAGEKTGDLPLTIKRFINFTKRAEGLRKKVLSALFYPAILVTVASIAVTVLLIYVVPTFSKIYADSGAQLPGPTLMLISVTTVLRKFFLLFIAIIVMSTALFRQWSTTEWGRYKVDSMKLKLPVLGKVLAKYSVAGFTRTFATVLGSGIPIVESLKIIEVNKLSRANCRVYELAAADLDHIKVRLTGMPTAKFAGYISVGAGGAGSGLDPAGRDAAGPEWVRHLPALPRGAHAPRHPDHPPHGVGPCQRGDHRARGGGDPHAPKARRRGDDSRRPARPGGTRPHWPALQTFSRH